MKSRIQLVALLLLFLFQFKSYSQTADWIVTNPGIATATCTDQFKNIFATGTFFGTANIGPYTFTGKGQTDVAVVKYDENGIVQWATQIGGTASDTINEIVYDGNGNIWVIGTFISSSIQVGSVTVNGAGSYDAFIAKISASTGKVLFATNIGTAGNDIGQDISTDGWGNIYVAGDYDGTLNYGSVTLPNQGVDIFILKLDSSGNAIWGKNISGSLTEVAQSMTVSTNGTVFISGASASFSITVSGTPYSNNPGNIFLTSVDSSGSCNWLTNAQTSGSFEDLCADASDNVYFTGYHLGSSSVYGNDTLSSNGLKDVLVGKINSSGNFAWAKGYGGAAQDRGHSINITNKGKLLVTGYYYSTSIGFAGYTLTGSGSGSYGYLVELDTAANVAWAIQTNGVASGHMIFSSAVCSSGEIYLSGNGYNTLQMNKHSVQVNQDFLIKVLDSANVIQGMAFIDLNGDGKKNGLDKPLKNVILELNPGKGHAATNDSGMFTMLVSKGQHTISIPNAPNYYSLSTPSSYSVNFSTFGNADTGRVFGFQPTPNVNDLDVDVTTVVPARVGQLVAYELTYSNKGTTSLAPVITFQADSSLSYLSASITPTSVVGQTYTWNTTTLNPTEKNSLTLYLNVSTSVNMGDTINSICTVGPTSNDTTPGDNTDTIPDIIVGPFDPNYKEVNKDTLYSVSNPDWLEYIIHFQNVGTDTAINVYVKDTLSQYLDPATLEIISSSAPVDLLFRSFSVVEFRFTDIMLPDSTTDSEGSNGFVKYRMKYLSSLPVNNSIENFADIYFDYNAPVRTDTANTIYIYPTSVNDLKESANKLSIYPNPSNGIVNVQFAALSDGIKNIKLYDITGKVVIDKPITSSNKIVQEQLNLSVVKPGLYILVVETGTTRISRQVVKR